MSHVTCHTSNLQKIITSKPWELGAWNFGMMFTTPYMSRDTFHMSCVAYHMSHVMCHVSCVTSHVSHVFFSYYFVFLFFGPICRASWLRVCFSSSCPTVKASVSRACIYCWHMPPLAVSEGFRWRLNLSQDRASQGQGWLAPHWKWQDLVVETTNKKM